MRIQRYPPLYTYRRPRRRGGCLPFTVLSGLVLAGLILSWGWISERFALPAPTPAARDLDPALQAFARGDLPGAVDYARQIYDAEPGRIDALTLLVRALIYQSYSDYDTGMSRDTALQLTEAAYRLDPYNPDVLAIHAFALHAASLPREAARLAERARQLDARHPLAQIALGLAYGGAGGYDNALREQQQVLQQGADGWELDARRALAISYSDLGRYQEAGATVEQAITLNPNLPVLYFERALYALQVGDASAATEAYFEIMARDSDNVKVRLRLCELSSTLRERDQALHYCAEVTELAPTWAEGWHRLGREYFLQGEFEAARQTLNRCTSLQVMQNVPVKERKFECWYLQGQAAEILGDCPALLATYNEFRVMTAESAIPQTWTYPPEGPPGCTDSAGEPTAVSP